MKPNVNGALPYCLVAVFLVVTQSLSISQFVSIPTALLAGAGWTLLIVAAAMWIRRRPTPSAWTEDLLIAVGVTTMAVSAFAGAAGILLWSSALDSSSITGETMMRLVLPSLPIAIAINVVTELCVIPVLLILGWRQGTRRVLIVTATGLYFVHRIWTYLVFAAERSDFASAARSTATLTDAGREQFAAALHLNDPRWILNLVIFGVFLAAAFSSRVRDLKR